MNKQRTILLFGAGKSATVLIDYLLENATDNSWRTVIADADRSAILSKINNHPLATAIEVDINHTEQRTRLIKDADIVISMMPPALHILIAKDCIAYQKNLLTASYVDKDIELLKDQIESKGLLFLCEMGLDPGIDHMSAMKIIDEIHANGGRVTSFKSHCGGLVAPESDHNPWHYKISWNPKNIIMAGKSGAIYKMNNSIVKENYTELFAAERGVKFDDEIGFLSYYPNRDSLNYIEVYGLPTAHTFLRSTLRYPGFMYGWNNVVALKLTDENITYDTNGLSIAAFFKKHFDAVKFGDWLSKKMEERLTGSAPALTAEMDESNLTLKQLFYLGMDDHETLINKGICTVAEILQFIAEKKLMLQPEDKDMIVMLHEIEYEMNGTSYKINSSLKVIGKDSIRTAMAKTVGLPLGIAAKLILNGTIKTTGLKIPTKAEIYNAVLPELEKNGIIFSEIKNNA